MFRKTLEERLEYSKLTAESFYAAKDEMDKYHEGLRSEIKDLEFKIYQKQGHVEDLWVKFGIIIFSLTLMTAQIMKMIRSWKLASSIKLIIFWR